MLLPRLFLDNTPFVIEFRDYPNDSKTERSGELMTR